MLNRGPSEPSVFYRGAFWRLGLFVARHLPGPIARSLCQIIAHLYWRLHPARLRVVSHNLAGVFRSNPPEARALSRKLFRQFALKLFDLWRYESGIPIHHLFEQLTGWEHLLAAQEKKRGVLLLTLHLGNWEFGAPLLAQRGLKLLVITLEEPDPRLTAMRQAARAKWGIETLVIGKDPFAFVEIIRRLEDGANVALLMDRPPASSATTVTLFGKPFAASVAAAELARASGCVLLPVYMPRLKKGYAAHILPEIDYARPTLRDPAARQELTQRIMRAFEEPIRTHPDQWYHFVPVWPDTDQRS